MIFVFVFTYAKSRFSHDTAHILKEYDEKAKEAKEEYNKAMEEYNRNKKEEGVEEGGEKKDRPPK